MKKILNFPLLILLAFIIRPLINGVSLGDAVVILGLSCLYAAYYYFESKKEPIANKELLNRVVELEEQIRITKDIVHSVKLGSSLRK